MRILTIKIKLCVGKALRRNGSGAYHLLRKCAWENRK